MKKDSLWVQGSSSYAQIFIAQYIFNVKSSPDASFIRRGILRGKNTLLGGFKFRRGNSSDDWAVSNRRHRSPYGERPTGAPRDPCIWTTMLTILKKDRSNNALLLTGYLWPNVPI